MTGENARTIKRMDSCICQETADRGKGRGQQVNGENHTQPKPKAWYFHSRFMQRAQGLQNRWEPVRFDRLPVKPVQPGFGLGWYQTGPNSKFKFKFKKMKNSQKISKNTSSCDESNGVKFFFKYSFIQYTLRAFEFKQKKRA